MNCQEFETNVTDLANGVMEESRRSAALAHSSSCGRCGVLLVGQRHLTAALRALAARQCSEEAPLRIEQQLVAAFRAHAESQSTSRFIPEAFAGTTESRDSGMLRQVRPLVRSWRLWGTVAAGAMFGALALHGLLRHPDASPVQSQPQAQSTAQVNPEREIREPMTPPSSGSRALHTALPITQRAAVRPHRAQRPAARPPDRAETVQAEVATDFYPIPYVEPALPGEALRIVRARVPRSSLATFGFPVNNEQAFDTVQADVLVGEDNIARAIRFVRQWQLPQTAPRPAPVNANYVR